MATPREVHEQLVRHPFFGGLPEAALAALAECARPLVFQAGEALAREGAQADAFFLIEHGVVAIETAMPGRGSLVLQTLHDGDIAGWSWLFPPYEWTFDVRALEKTSVLALDGRCLRGRCEADPRLGYDLMRKFAGVMTQRLKAARLRLIDLYGDGAGG
jgi:CRP-like cAMP-binding protein